MNGISQKNPKELKVQGQYIGGQKVGSSRSALASLELYWHDMANHCTVPRQSTCQYHFQFSYNQQLDIFHGNFFLTEKEPVFSAPISYFCSSAGSTYPPVMSPSWSHLVLSSSFLNEKKDNLQVNSRFAALLTNRLTVNLQINLFKQGRIVHIGAAV